MLIRIVSPVRPLLAALLLLAGCGQQEALLEDALKAPETRCQEARGIIAGLADPTKQELALALAACGETILGG